MTRIRAIRLLVPILLASLVAACSSDTADTAGTQDSTDASRPAVRVLSGAEVYARNPERTPQQLIADLLFEGLQALDQDRLLTPVDNNAHARFKRVLAYDPDNKLALEGLESIVLRYVELADGAIRQGLFDQAHLFLDRARFVDPTHRAIVAAESRLQSEQDSGDLFFDLDAGQIAARSEAVQEELAEIARQARDHEAFFLITAPNDEQARWMFSVMRDAVSGYRLRGNIELAARHSIRLRLPEDHGE